MWGASVMKNTTFKKQFIISIVLVIALSFTLTIGGVLLELWLTKKGVILTANYYSSKVPKVEDYISKNKDKIINKSSKKEFEKIIPTAGIEYEVVNSKGQLSYGYFKKPIVYKISMVSKEKTESYSWFNGIDPKIIKYIPVLDNNNKVIGMVILKYFIRSSAKNPHFNWMVEYFDLYPFTAPFIYIIFFSIIFGRIFSRNLNVPLNQLMAAAEKIRTQDLNFNITYKDNNELGKLCNSFENMRASLKEALEKQWKLEEERKEMIGAVAHDLRTPITIIKGHVEGLLESKHLDNEKLYRYLNLIDNNTDRMSKLVEKINLLTKIERTDFKLNNKACDLIAYMNEKNMEYNILVKDKKIKFTCKIEDLRASNTLINIDTYALSEMLDNIVSNSIRFTPEEGSIKLELRLSTNKLKFSVLDTGCGFSNKDIKNVFKSFYQGDESRSKEKGHSGLGLYIVKTLVDKFNGCIEASNNACGGAEVKIYIPMA